MKLCITYTVFALIDLIAFAIVSALLPAQVAVGFGGGTVSRLGSPWQFLALPAVSALLSVALFVIELRMQRGRRPMLAAVVSLGALFLCIGWMFLGVAAQGAAFGERVNIPYAVLTALPLSLLLMALGYLLPAAQPIGPLALFAPKKVSWERVSRVGRVLLMAAGTLTAVVSVVLSCTASAQYDYAAIALFLAAAGAAVTATAVYSRTARPSE